MISETKLWEPETCVFFLEHLAKWLQSRVVFSGWWNLCKTWMKEEPKDSSERFQQTRTLPDSYHSQKINLYSRLDENSTWIFRVASPNVNNHVERSLCRLYRGPFFLFQIHFPRPSLEALLEVESLFPRSSKTSIFLFVRLWAPIKIRML